MFIRNGRDGTANSPEGYGGTHPLIEYVGRKKSMTTNDDVGGANPSYQGYDYQKLVTVWVALKLMFRPGVRTDRITIEPASHDDIKANLDVPPDAAECNLSVEATGELHVQIKFKGAGAWSPKDFAGVVNDKPAQGTRGPKPRARAKALMLADTTRRYVFITNASVDGALAMGRVNSPEELSDPTFTPTNLNLKAGEIVAGRFALIEGMTLEATRQKIDKILTGVLNVPSQGLDGCVERLKRAVEDRFLAVRAPLHRNDVEKIAEAFGGLPHANPQLAFYVAPGNFDSAEASLDKHGAVLLIGPSGYGKSLTADKLAYDRRQADPPYKIVRREEGLGAIEDAFAAPGRVLFHLEDPWGQSRFKKGEAEEWTKRIGDLIAQNAPDKLFVITSRSEIYRAAISPLPASRWSRLSVTIDDNSYGEAARRKILHGKLKGEGNWRQDLAQQHQERLLKDLKSPLELISFARELIAVTKPIEAKVKVLVDRALTDSRLQVVRDQINAYGDRGERGAAVLWALLRFSRALPPKDLADLRREVDKEREVDIGLDDLAGHLAQTQLTTDGDGAYVAHAKVIEAMEVIARANFRGTEDALNASSRAALRLVAVKGSGWISVVERLVTGARSLKDAGVELGEEIVEAFDKILIDELAAALGKPGSFRTAWRNADRYLSSRHPIGRLVHWLEHGAPKAKGRFADFGWKPPEVSQADREALLAADPKLCILKGFIAHQLPWTDTDYDADKLSAWLAPFRVDIAKAFLDAGEVVSHMARYVMCADTIADCALAGSSPPYDAVWTQIERMQEIVDTALATSKEDRRQAWQGELDFAHCLHVQERAEEQGSSADLFAKGYVRARRRRDGHGWIVGHPRQDIILPLWAEVMKLNLPAVTSTELDAFFTAAGDDDHLQAAGLSVIADRRLNFGRDRVFASLNMGKAAAINAAVRALSFLEGDGEGTSDRPSAQTILLDLLPTLPPTRAVMLAPEIVNLESGQSKAGLAQRVLAAAPPEAAAAVHLALARVFRADDATLLNRFRELPPGQAETLMVEGPRNLTRLLLLLSGAKHLDIQARAEQWVRSDDEADAQAAVRALAELGTPEARAAIVNALTHAHYKVRRTALEVLAPSSDTAERAAIFGRVVDRSAPVRMALAKVIGQQAWPEGLDVLVTLLGDRRNYCRHPGHQRRDEPEYQVARTAAEALARYDTLPPHVLDKITTFLADDNGEAIDVVLHTTLIDLLSYPDHPTAWTTLERGLTDVHVVGDADENLYPVRYAAAWAIVDRISRHPFERNLVPWAAIRAAADHIDAQLAAPLLLALGDQLAVDSDAATLEALRGKNASDVRTALALSMIDDHEAAADLARRHGLLAADHPFLDQGNDLAAGGTEVPRWSLSTRAREWLLGLREGADVEATLLWMMAHRTGFDFGVSEFMPSVLRRNTSIPITTPAELFGME